MAPAPKCCHALSSTRKSLGTRLDRTLVTGYTVQETSFYHFLSEESTTIISTCYCRDKGEVEI